MMKTLIKFCGFCGVGGAMTLLSIVLIALTNEFLHWEPLVSYVFAYVLTLLLSCLLNARYVFRSKLNIKKTVLYFFAYLSGMLLGMALLKILILTFKRTNVTLLNCLVVAVTVVWNFLLVNKILRKTKGDANV